MNGDAKECDLKEIRQNFWNSVEISYVEKMRMWWQEKDVLEIGLDQEWRRQEEAVQNTPVEGHWHVRGRTGKDVGEY